MSPMTSRIDEITEIATLSRDVPVATDEGTHDGPATVRVFETLEGRRYGVKTTAGVQVSCPPPATGLRPLDHLTADARRARVAALQAAAATLTGETAAVGARREELARGWDDGRFIGVEAGRARIAGQ